LEGHSDFVRALAVTPDGTRLVSASADETPKVWDLATGRELLTLEGHSDWVRAVAVTPDGTRVVSGSRDNTLKVWDLATGVLLEDATFDPTRFQSLTHRPEEQGVEIKGPFLQIRNTADGQEIARFAADATISAANYSARRQTAAAGDRSGRVHILRLRSHRDSG
jgi:WD40 repeat protein